MVLGIQVSRKWKSQINIKQLLHVQILYMKIGGHLPVDYTKYLPNSLAFLSNIINAFYFAFNSFLNLHICALYLVQFIKYSYSEASVTQISDALMSTILHAYGFSAGLYMQLYHRDCVKIFEFMNENFKMRSAKGKIRKTKLNICICKLINF